jgi:UDP-glucose 4-epimerase
MGYVGSHTCIALWQAGYEPIIYDNLTNSNADVLQYLAEICGHCFQFVHADVADAEVLEATLRKFKIQGVIHFAAFKAVGESTHIPLRYYQNNVCCSHTLMEVMHKLVIKRLVFSSSATVYGNPQYLPLDEQHPLLPTNPYGWSKLMVEQMIRDQCAADCAWLGINLRYFNPVGAHPSGLLGENPNGIPNNLMPFITQTAAGLRRQLLVYGDDYDTPDGTGVRDYVHVMDLAAGHVSALTKLFFTPGCHTFNLGTGTGYSVLQVLHAFESVTGVSIPYLVTDRRAGDVASSFASATLAQKIFGWQAQSTLDQMITDSWRWQSRQQTRIQS